MDVEPHGLRTCVRQRAAVHTNDFPVRTSKSTGSVPSSPLHCVRSTTCHPPRARDDESYIIVGSSAGKSVYAELECQLFVKFVSQPKLSRLSLPNGCFLSAAPGRRRCLSARRRTRVLGIRLAGVWSFAARSHSQSCLHPRHQPSPASLRSARVRSARPRASGPTLHALSRARSHRRSRARRLRWRSPLAAQAGDTARFSLTRVHRPEDVQSVVAPWKAPFGSMRSCLVQSRGSHQGAVMPRHSHFRFTIRTSLAPQLVRRPAAVADLLRVSWVHRIARRDRIGGWRSDDYKATTAVMLEAPESARRTDSYVQQTTHKRQSTCENRLYRTFMALIGISS